VQPSLHQQNPGRPLVKYPARGNAAVSTVEVKNTSIYSSGATSGRAASPLVTLGLWFISIYLFAAFSRMSETIVALFGIAVRLPMVVLAFALLCTVFHPSLVRAVQNRIGLILTLLTMWFLVCVPFSVHRGGSIKFLFAFWLTALLLCACVMVLGQDIASIRRMLYAVVSGVLVVLILSIIGSSYPAMQSALGGMQNPNLYGQHLLYTVPFLFVPIFRHGLVSLRGMTAAAGSLLIVSKVVFTGSRASLIATALLVCLVFLRLPFVKKMGMAMASIPAMGLILLLMPDLAWERYRTILQNDIRQIQTGEALSAIESANVRKIHLQQSIDLTILNPVFGVGPGMFPVASADYSRDLGERALWKETHNSYTQISSETGVLGLILYTAMLVMTILTQIKVMRLARSAPENSALAECGVVGYSLFVSTLVTLVTGNFSSVAYQIYFPLLGAFSIALLHVTTQGRELAPSLRRQPLSEPRPWLKRFAK
jgi:O-antigen ligase